MAGILHRDEKRLGRWLLFAHAEVHSIKGCLESYDCEEIWSSAVIKLKGLATFLRPEQP